MPVYLRLFQREEWLNYLIDAVWEPTNRFSDNQGFLYDKNGNVVGDIDPITSSARTFVFNGDNKQTEVKRGTEIVGRYFNDGEGKRVKKQRFAGGVLAEETIFVYSSGKLVAEYSNLPSQTPTVAYTTTDHLGSPRIITDQYGQVRSRRDFMPFGEDIFENVGASRTASLGYSTSQDDLRQKFTGYQKDAETQLDFAEARMYENRFGRFTAVDPLLASGKDSNPQTFNRFVYVGNNPLNIIDPLGLEWWRVRNKQNKTDSIFWSTETPVGEEGDVVDKWTEYVYRANDGLWYSLDPNSENYSRWLSQERAEWDNGYYTGFNGYGKIPVWGTFVLPMLSGIKTGNVDRAMYGFWGTAATLATAPRTIGGILKEGASEAFSAVTGLPVFNIRKPLSNDELVQKAADYAHRRTPGVGRFAGIEKHEYATRLLTRYQERYKDRIGDTGLRFGHYFNNGAGNRGFLDVYDIKNNKVYDWKFVNPSVSTQKIQSSPQIQKYERNFGVPVNIVRPTRW